MAIANSIFWENQDAGGMDETAQIFGSVITISNTCVQGWTGALGGSNNTANCDPSFVNSAGRDQSPGTLDDNLRLGESSLNINAGNNAIDIDAFRGGLQSLPAQDLAGYPRILDSVVDRGAYEFFVDCNGNGLPDSQDISGATSADIDENSVPDECPPPVFLQDATGILKTRFISFAPAAGWGADTAIRVKLISLHHVNPPYSGGPSVPFMSFEGESRWVGQPAQYVESTSTGTPLFAASLRCTPYYQDWSTIPLLHVTGSAIVPSSVYEITNVASPCMGIEATCTANSVPLTVNTTRWADVETPYNPPSTTTQPDLGDVAALVNKFKSVPGAPIKARALLAGDDAFGNISTSTLSLDLGFGHIAACVDAFKGKPYPHTIQACP